MRIIRWNGWYPHDKNALSYSEGDHKVSFFRVWKSTGKRKKYLKKFSQKTSLFCFIWHIIYTGNRRTKTHRWPVKNAGPFRPDGNRIFKYIGHNSGAKCRMCRLICMTVQKMAKMSTNKWAVNSLPPKILGTADRTLVIRWTRERSVRTSLRQMNPPQEAGDKYSRTVNGRLPVGHSQCPASWQIVRAEQKFLQENNSNFSRSGQCPLNA